jgi:hypothetical protein
MWLWVALAFAVLWGVMFAVEQGTQRRRLATLRREWGSLRLRDRDMAKIAAYSRATRAPETLLDDRTWNDLNMDDVYSVLDRTESVVGQQVLYTRLRSAPRGREIDAFEALVAHVTADASARERAQLALGHLRAPAGYDLWWLAQPHALETAPWHVLFPVAGVSMLGLAILVPFWPPAIIVLVAGSLGSLVARALIAPSLRVVAGAFRQLNPLIAAAGEMKAFPDAAAPLVDALRQDVPHLSRLRRVARWAGRDSSAAVAGDLPALLFEYLNMVLWLDANALFFGARELRARAPELLRVIAAVGEVDSALSVASFRASTVGWTRPIITAAGPMVLNDVRHPLLPDAVPNSIALAPPAGIVITGSNMSGKSTFLRTIGVTAIMAQTINTCLASRYEAPLFVVRSCIGLADDPAAGKSYYLVEVESVLALVHAARAPVAHLMLFDELFRGTNAVERIAAAEAVLVSLLAGSDAAPASHVVIAATHDQELVDLLQGLYAAYHFTDSIDADGLAFDYRLQPGPATTRNAIALLAQRGAPPELVSHALERAQRLDDARRSAAPQVAMARSLR